jgi:hypothetical protein
LWNAYWNGLKRHVPCFDRASLTEVWSAKGRFTGIEAEVSKRGSLNKAKRRNERSAK